MPNLSYESALLEAPEQELTEPVQGGSDPYATALKDAAPEQDPYAAALTPDTGIKTLVIDALKEQGRGLVQAMKYFASGMGNPAAGLGIQIGDQPSPSTALIRDEAAAQSGDVEAQKRLQRGAMGNALIASTVGASAAHRGLRAGKSILTGADAGRITRGLRFVTAEAIGGGIYGYVDPNGRDRATAVVEDAAAFAIAGPVLHGAFKATGFLAGKLIPQGVKDVLANVKTKPEAEVIAKRAAQNYENLKPAGDDVLTQPEIVATQAAAVEAAVNRVDIPKRITPEVTGTPFPKITPVHRSVLKTFFGQDAKIYESAYKVMKEADSGEKYAMQKKLMTAMEARLNPEQKAQLRALDNSGWEDELARALEAGDELAAADIAITRAVEEVPIAEMASQEVKAEAAKIKEVITPRATVGASEGKAGVAAPTPAEALNGEMREAVKLAMTDGDVEKLALKVFADVAKQRDQTIAGMRASWKPEFKAMREAEAVHPSDILPVGVERAAPEVTTNPSVLYARASDAVKKMMEDEGGAIASKMAAQIAGRAVLGTGSYFSFEAMDEDNRLVTNTGLFALGAYLGLAAALPGKRAAAWLTTSEHTSKYVKWADVRRYATTEGKEGFDLWHSITNTARTEAVFKANKLREMLSTKPGSLLAKTDPVLNTNFGLAVDEGHMAPEFHLLSPDMQKEAISLKMVNDANGAWLKAQGYVDDVRENYFRNILPTPKKGKQSTFDYWLAKRAEQKALGNTAAVARLETLRGVVDLAKQAGLEGPIENVAEAQAKHMVDVGKIVARNEIRKFFESVNRVVPYEPLKMPNGWRKVEGMEQMAPDDIATILERVVKPSVDKNLVDSMKGTMMKTIMIFPWEHGVNLIRGVGALANPIDSYKHYKMALDQITAADPMIVEKSKYMQLFKQPDLLDETGFANLLKKIGLEKLTVLHHASERMLWERWAPATALATHSLEMLKWTNRTKGKHLIGSVEYEAAARKYGRFADDVAGKLPELLQDPKMAFAVRTVLFSPSWTRTRIGITLESAKELQDIMTGELKPDQATYLPYKMKALAFGAAFTWALSKLWGKEDPQFNPNTTKLYARTGLFDDRGRELGVDLVGWWQDDIKLFNDPLMFFEHRLNPLLRSTYQGFTRRDAFGNELTYEENFYNVFKQLGPLTSIPESIVKTATGHMDSREAVKQGSELAAVGNVSSLPKLTDITIAKMGEKIIRRAGLPVHRKDVFEITRLMKQNHRMSGTMVGKNIESWIAYKRRAQSEHNPVMSLWYGGKKAIADLFDE